MFILGADLGNPSSSGVRKKRLGDKVLPWGTIKHQALNSCRIRGVANTISLLLELD